jgi:hypothetical protein
MRDKRPEWQEEIDRMREHRNFVNYFPFLPLEKPTLTTEPQNNSVLNVICHNIQNYLAQTGYNRQACVQADFGFQEADVILLVEAHLNANHLAARPGLSRPPSE